ncbi:hypothetical protein, partial [Pseudomonas viridiflava]
MYGTANFNRSGGGAGGVARAARTAAVVFAFFLGTGSVQASLGPERHSYFKPKVDAKYTLAEKNQGKAVEIDWRGPDEHLDNIKA